MNVKRTKKSRKPFHTVKKRLFENPAAMVGFGIIAFSFCVMLLGYLIMPDDTPNANGGSQFIRKMLPGFEVNVLKMRKQRPIKKVNFLQYLLSGQESEYLIFPYAGDYQIVGDSVFFTPYLPKESTARERRLSRSRPIKEHLLKVVRAVYNAPSDKLTAIGSHNFIKKDNTYTYLDQHKQVQTITRTQLLKEFEENCLERKKYWLGTNSSGRDVLSLLIFGTRISLFIGLMSVVISLLLGVTLGALAGFFGGLVDNLINWFMTVTWSIPSIMLVIIISVLFNKGIWIVFIAVGLTMWVEIARIVRTEIMSIKQKKFVEAARAFGYSNRRIIFKHILPNVLAPIFVIATNNFALAILTEAGLSFLGFGVQPPMPSWGVMVNEGFNLIATKNSWHLVVLPSLAISTMVLAFNLFGNGLRDAYDPKSVK